MLRCVDPTPVIDSMISSGTIKPGMMVLESVLGTVIPHNVYGGTAILKVALEDEYSHAGEITDAYTSGDKVRVWTPRRGDRVAVLIYTSENIAFGDFLDSQGDGYFKEVDLDASAGTVRVGSVLLRALEAQATGDEATHIMCEAL
jgi:hypothetical protein